MLGQDFERARTEATRDGAILEGDDESGGLGLLDEQRRVDGLGETGVDHSHGQTGVLGQLRGHRLGFGHHRAERPKLDVGAGLEHLRLAQRKQGRLGLDGLPRGRTARVTDEHRGAGAQRRVQHVGEFILILGLHQRDVRHAPQVGDVEETVVRRAIARRNAGAVHAERHRQALQADVMDDHVVGALQESGVNRADRPEVARGQAGGEEGRVFLGDADVVILTRQRLLELVKPGTGGHRGGDADNLGIGLGLTDQQSAEDILPRLGRAGLTGSQAVAGLRIEGAGAMELLRILEGRAQAPTLFGADVQQHGALGVFAEAQVLLDRREVVAIDGSDVTDAILLEERGIARVPILHVPLEAAPEIEELGADARPPQEALQPLLRLVVGTRDDQLVQDLGDRPDVAVDRPLVVVQDDDQALRRVRGVVERLHRDTAGEGRVTDQRDHVRVFAETVAGIGEAHGGGEGRPRMARTEDVVQALFPIQEARQTTRGADAVEVGAVATRQQLVHVTLVRDVEDELILGRVEDAVEGDGQLHHAEVGADVAAVLGRDGDEAFANLLREQRQLGRRQRLHVLRAADLSK